MIVHCAVPPLLSLAAQSLHARSATCMSLINRSHFMPFKPQTVLVYARCFLWKCTYSHEWSEKGRPLLCSPTLSCPVISLFVYVCVQSHNTVHYHFIIHSAGICLFLCVYLLIEHYVHSACMLHVRVCVQVCVQVYICVCVCVCVCERHWNAWVHFSLI